MITTLNSLYFYQGISSKGSSSDLININPNSILSVYNVALSNAREGVSELGLASYPEIAMHVAHTYTGKGYVRRNAADDAWTITPYTLEHGSVMQPRLTFTVPDGRRNTGVRLVNEGSNEHDDYVEFAVDYLHPTTRFAKGYLDPSQGDEAARLARQAAGDFKAKSPTGPIDPNSDFVRIFSSGTSQ